MPEKFTDTPLLTERFDTAMQLALDHHRRQLRKATDIPYVSHLLAVTAIVLELGCAEDEAIAALLHDAVEDGGGPAMQERIARDFGAAVGEMVKENTDTDEDPKPPWPARKAAYIAAMPGKSAGGLRVSLADKLHNARAITADLRREREEVWERFTASGPETAQYYAALAAAFEAELGRLGPRAEPAVAELRGLADALVAAVGTPLSDAQPVGRP